MYGKEIKKKTGTNIKPVILNPRVCTRCNETKNSMTDFYINRHQCITCVREYENKTRRKKDEERKINNGGSERVKQRPGDYADEYQEGQVTEFLTLLGWVLNENGVWSKDGFKDKDKKWEIPIKKYKRLNNSHCKGSERSPVYLKRDELVKLREGGMTYQKICDIYGISPATVLRIIKDKYDKK
jgi:hypothetical protein